MAKRTKPHHQRRNKAKRRRSRRAVVHRAPSVGAFSVAAPLPAAPKRRSSKNKKKSASTTKQAIADVAGVTLGAGAVFAEGYFLHGKPKTLTTINLAGGGATLAAGAAATLMGYPTLGRGLTAFAAAHLGAEAQQFGKELGAERGKKEGSTPEKEESKGLGPGMLLRRVTKLMDRLKGEGVDDGDAEAWAIAAGPAVQGLPDPDSMPLDVLVAEVEGIPLSQIQSQGIPHTIARHTRR